MGKPTWDEKSKEDLTELLREIQGRNGKLKNFASLNSLIRKFLERGEFPCLPRDSKSDAMKKVRQKIGTLLMLYGRPQITDTDATRGRNNYSLSDLIELGPKGVFETNYLDSIGLGHKEENNAEEDERPIDSSAIPENDTELQDDPEPTTNKETDSIEEVAEESRDAAMNESEAPSRGRKRRGEASSEIQVAPHRSHAMKMRARTTSAAVGDVKPEPDDDATFLNIQKSRSMPASAVETPKAPTPAGGRSQAHAGSPIIERAAESRTGIAWREDLTAAQVRPPNPESEIVNSGNGDWLAEHMGRLEDLLWTGVGAYLQENNISPEAQSRLPTAAVGTDLGELYILLFTKRHWVDQIRKLKTQTPEPVLLRQDFLLFGLFGAVVHKGVFAKKELYWDIRRTAPGRLRGDWKYLKQVEEACGLDSDKTLRLCIGLQIRDPDFRKRQVANKAESLVRDAETTLLRHFQHMVEVPSGAAAAAEQRRLLPWETYLQMAFEVALVIKQTLAGSSLSRCAFCWPRHGSELDPDKHQCKFEMAGANRTLHGILPGIAEISENGPKVAWRALVIPAMISDG